MRTLLSAIAIGVQVTMILTLVGVSEGSARRHRGALAGHRRRYHDSSAGKLGIGLFGNMPEGIVTLVRKEPHVALATGTLVQSIGNFDSIAGIHLDEFNAMSGGFRYLEGGPFTKPGDIIVDDVYANSNHRHPGRHNRSGAAMARQRRGRVREISRMFADIKDLQDKYSRPAHGQRHLCEAG